MTADTPTGAVSGSGIRPTGTGPAPAVAGPAGTAAGAHRDDEQQVGTPFRQQPPLPDQAADGPAPVQQGDPGRCHGCLPALCPLFPWPAGWGQRGGGDRRGWRLPPWHVQPG